MKCIVIETSPERIAAKPVTNEDGTPHIYATIKEARAELKANGYSYNRENQRYYIKGTDYRAYIIRKDSEEYAATIEQAEQQAAPTPRRSKGAPDMKTAEELIKAYAEAIGEPAPEYMAESARLVFLAQEEGGKRLAPMHYDTADLMRKVVAAHESDPDALRELFEDLKAGSVYGHQVNNVPYPFFWENVGIHDGYIKWNHYGASANAVSMNDLAFVVFVIFRTTPRRFMTEYERR